MGVDAITVGSQIAVALQTIVSRKLNPADNGILSITEFITDGKKNVLPGKVTIKGDARALSKETSALIEKNMRQIVKGICDSHGVTAKVSYKTTIIPTFNSSQQTEGSYLKLQKIFLVIKIQMEIVCQDYFQKILQ